MSKRVMVIDDDENAVKFLSLVLSENGYEPLAAYDGREGLEKLKENKVDLIILDVMMPRKTGFVLFKQMKRDENLKDIPVLMLTGVAATLEDVDSESGDTHERPYDSLRESLRKTIKEPSRFLATHSQQTHVATLLHRHARLSHRSHNGIPECDGSGLSRYAFCKCAIQHQSRSGINDAQPQ